MPNRSAPCVLLLACAQAMAGLASAQDGAQAAAATEIKRLSWLVGHWSYQDASVDSVAAYRDAGTRTCDWALDGAYIRCESVGRAGDRDRRYLFYFNYNWLDGRFEMVALNSDYPRKTVYTIEVSEDGRQLELLGPQTARRSGGSSQSWATITYNGTTEMRWETRIHRSGQRPDEWKLSYLETAVRVPR
jgi:hypothetical protein